MAEVQPREMNHNKVLEWGNTLILQLSRSQLLIMLDSKCKAWMDWMDSG